ncbi:MAG: bifunctional 4-hydroxy-2-oxoglutarate aldolase/2-dehydro-3-deoxy-phosphogluconate aldolase [Microcystaceae cyanobacterium]
MKKEQWRQLLIENRVIAVIRSPNFDTGLNMAKAVAKGGIRLIEVTWNSVDPLPLIKQLQRELPHCVIGVGTILTILDLKEAIAAKAQFCFSPHTDIKLIKVAQKHQIPIVTGALTPTEIVKAWQGGASAVKVFPIATVGGVNYLRAIKAPLGEIPLIPTGGVTLDNAAALIDAGAIAVGLSGQLFPKQAVASQNWSKIRDNALLINAYLLQKDG